MQFPDIVARPDEILATDDFAGVDASASGLQVGPGKKSVRKIAFVVDVTEATIDVALDADADLLVVHHGLIWDGLDRVTGRGFDRIEPLVRGDLAPYASHLPFDGHQEPDNVVGVADHPDLGNTEPSGSLGPIHIGQAGSSESPQIANEVRAAPDELDGSMGTTVLDLGPDEISSVGIVTDPGVGWLDEAINRDVGTLVTGRGKQKVYHEVCEAGTSVLLVGHYATEAFGVRNLRDLADERGPEVEYVSHSVGL